MGKLGASPQPATQRVHDSIQPNGTPQPPQAPRAGAVPPGSEALEALLWSAREGWDLAAATWIPLTGDPLPLGGTFKLGAEPLSSGRRFRPREVDWSVLTDLVPGACLGSARQRSPRAAASTLDQLWAVPSHSSPCGVLHLMGEGHNLPGPERARELAQRLNELGKSSSPEPADRAQEAGWAHDLRNRLTHALLGLERMRREHGGSAGAASLDEVARSLELARAACVDRLGNGPAGHGEVREVRTQPLRALLLRAVQGATEIAGAGERCAVRVLLRCPATLDVSAGGPLVHRAIENLTLNALQASEPGSEVRIEATRERGCVIVTVADQGCGMGAEELETFRIPGRTGRRAQGGTGYGSASLFDCLGQLDAELDLETALHVGTTARVRWPDASQTIVAGQVHWSPWQPLDGVERLRFALPADGIEWPTASLPRGAFGPHAAQFLELCAQWGLTVEVPSCLTEAGTPKAPANDVLGAPLRATWAARSEPSVSRTT